MKTYDKRGVTIRTRQYKANNIKEQIKTYEDLLQNVQQLKKELKERMEQHVKMINLLLRG